MENKKNEEQMTNTPQQPAQTPPSAPKPEPVQQPQTEQINEPTVADKSSKNKKIKIGIIVAACAVAVVGLIFLIAGLISNNTKLATPTGLEVVETPNGDIFVYVDKCSGAVKYKFEIENTNTKQRAIVEPTTNVWDITESMGKTAKYKITCQYIGKTLKTTSNYCENIEYTITKKIATPTIDFGEYNGHKVLFCKTQNRFDENIALNFALIYTNGQMQQTNTDFEIIDSTSKGYSYGYFNLENIFLTQNTQYQLAVQVSTTEAQQEFYKASDLSKQVFYKVV